MKRWGGLLAAALALGLLAGCGAGEEGIYLFDRLEASSVQGGAGGEEELSLILTHSAPAGSLTDQAARLLKEKVEAASDQAIQIQIYPEDSLGNLDDGRWYFENGAVDMRMGAGPSKISSVATWLPLLTGASAEEISQALRPGQPLWSLMCRQEGSALVLGVLPPTSRVMTSNRRVEELSDLSGLTVRIIPGSRLDQMVWQALGAKTVELPVQDLYLALQQGLADAQENPIYLIRSYGFQQQQKYLIPSNFKVYMETIYINQGVYEGMTPEQRELLTLAVEETCTEMVEESSRYLEECWEIFSRDGMEVRPVTDQERQRVRDTVQPLLEEYLLDLYGQKILQSVLDAMDGPPE